MNSVVYRSELVDFYKMRWQMEHVSSRQKENAKAIRLIPSLYFLEM